jgi:hypothetical protein
MPLTTWDGVTWKAPTVGLGTSMVACCQSDQAEVVVVEAARAHHRPHLRGQGDRAALIRLGQPGQRLPERLPPAPHRRAPQPPKPQPHQHPLPTNRKISQLPIHVAMHPPGCPAAGTRHRRAGGRDLHHDRPSPGLNAADDQAGQLREHYPRKILYVTPASR